MMCPSCGAEVGAEGRFCPRCGAGISPSAGYGYGAGGLPPGSQARFRRGPRVARNLQTMGVLWCVFGVYRLLAALAAMFAYRLYAMRSFGGDAWPFPGHMPSRFPMGLIGAAMPFVEGAMVVSAILAFVVGYSLLTRQSWGRILAIIGAFLTVLKFPLGTALGVYTLYVLLPGESGLEYDGMVADAQGGAGTT